MSRFPYPLRRLTGLFLLLTVFTKPVAGQSVPPKRELRGVWIATVDNIDWPRRGDYSPISQKQHFLNILDAHQATGINAVFVQVRDAADAYYGRGTEPWSEWLTGRQGRAPEPFYDPLDFMIEEAHARRMEFHAWLNLNRAVFNKLARSVAPDHVSRRHPEWLLRYGDLTLFDMGRPDVRTYITGIVTNLVRQYDLDGIHFDDYFYPYVIAGQTLRDGGTFRQYPNGFTKLDAWRRNNCDLLIRQIADSIRAVNPRVKFGISPFGIWRNRGEDPDGSETRGGTTSYRDLFADTRRWIREGWIDYIAPQVYFDRAHRQVPYGPLVDWWARNSFGRHVYVGQGAYRMGGKEKGWSSRSELPEQLRFNRARPTIQGSLFFSSKSLTENYGGFQDSLRRDFYRLPALIPPMVWKDSIPPNRPEGLGATLEERDVVLSWQPPAPATDGEAARYFVLYRFPADTELDWEDATAIRAILPADQTTYTDSPTPGTYRYLVTAFDRLHNESDPSALLEVRVRP
jgi:uncharacterized lipoprotein YddW (UPF0748 family)